MSFLVSGTSRVVALGMSNGDLGSNGGLVILDIEVRWIFRANAESNSTGLLLAQTLLEPAKVGGRRCECVWPVYSKTCSTQASRASREILEFPSHAKLVY